MKVSGRAQEPVPSVEKWSSVACVSGLAALLFYSKSWLSTNFVYLDWMEHGIRHFKTNTKCGKEAGVYSWTLAVSAVSALCPSVKLTAGLGPLKLITFPSIIVTLTLDILRLSHRILLRKDWEFFFFPVWPFLAVRIVRSLCFCNFRFWICLSESQISVDDAFPNLSICIRESPRNRDILYSSQKAAFVACLGAFWLMQGGEGRVGCG